MDHARQTRSAAGRLLLAAAAVLCAVAMLGPFQGIENRLISPDKAAHFAAFYGLTLLMFAAFPARRRLDLVALAVLAGSGVEILQGLTGRDAELGDVLADAAGAFAVLAPSWLESARYPRRERRQARSRISQVAKDAPDLGLRDLA
jgi:VanZ family protein